MIERLVEKSADMAAGAVSAVQRLCDLRRNFSPTRLAMAGLRALARLLGELIVPARPILTEAPSTALAGAFRLLFPGLLSPPSGNLTRRALAAAIRMAPAAWTVARDDRTRSVLAVLLRVAFGHTRRRPYR